MDGWAIGGAGSEKTDESYERNVGTSSDRANGCGTTGAGAYADDNKFSAKRNEVKASVEKFGLIPTNRGTTTSFSKAIQIMTDGRSSLGRDNVALLFLRTV